MESQQKTITGIILVVALILGLMYFNIIPSLFTIGPGSVGIAGDCASVSIDATFTATQGECYVYTLNNQQSVMRVDSMQTIGTSTKTCRIGISPPSSKSECLNGKIFTEPGVKTNYCDSNADCPDTRCTNHICTNIPTNTCTVVGAKQCLDTGSYQECGSNFRWAGGLPCSQGTACYSGNCVALCTSADWTSSDGVCQSNNQLTRTWSKISNCADGVQKTNQQISCTYQAPVCTSWTYNSWLNCTSSNQQTRTVASALPANCQGGSPILTQSCIYAAACTDSNWALTLGTCTNGQQTVTYAKFGNCDGGVIKTSGTQSCTVPALTCDTFTYSGWTSCQSTGVRTKTVLTQSPVGCSGGPVETLSEACTFVDANVTLPACTDSNWKAVNGTCTNSSLVVSYDKTGSCSGGVAQPVSINKTCTEEKSFLDQYLWYIVGGIIILVLVLVLKK